MNALEQAKSALKDAIEGECDGIAITDAQAGRILDYLASVQLSALSSAETAKPIAWLWTMHGWAVTAHGKHRAVKRYVDLCKPPISTQESDDFISLMSLYAAPQQAAQPAPAGMTDEEIDNLLEQARIGIVEGFGYKYDEKHLAEMLRSLSRSNAPQPEAAQPAPTNAIVYPPDGTVSPFAVINLGYGGVQIGDSIHDHRLPALWFGKEGKGMGHEEDLNREAKEGETIAVVTFANVEGLDVLLTVLQRIREKSFPDAALPLPAQQAQCNQEVHDALQKAFMSLQSSGGEGRSIVLKFNSKETAYIVHAFLLHCAVKDDPSNAGAQQVAEQKDAERYRWLRAPNTNVALVLDKVVGFEAPTEGLGGGGYHRYEYRAGEELDAAIDAAIQSAKGEGNV
jgi:hypothetical protein